MKPLVLIYDVHPGLHRSKFGGGKVVCSRLVHWTPFQQTFTERVNRRRVPPPPCRRVQLLTWSHICEPCVVELQPFRWGDVYAFVDQDVIMLRSVTDQGDAEELTEDAAERLAHWLLDSARALRG